MPKINSVTRILFWSLSLMVALASLRFLVIGMAEAFSFLIYHFEERPLAFVTHVTLAPLALFLMPLQFSTRLRARRPRVHRWIGRTYGVAVLFAAIGGFFMALGTQAGTLAAMGFALLAVLWLATTAAGVARARAGNITLHRQWMIRSAALTFAAVTLRIYVPLLPVLGVSFEFGYPLISWLCWVPNLMVAEWMILRRRRAANAPLMA